MKRFSVNMIPMLVSFYLFLCLKSAYSAERDFMLGENSLKHMDLELKPMFGSKDDQKILDDLEIKKFYDASILYNNAVIQHDNFLKSVNNYLQRYVSLFLTISGLLGQEFSGNSDELIRVDLEITITPDDLAYLQNFAKTSHQSTILNDFSRLDAIFSNVAKRKETSFIKSSLNFSLSLFYQIIVNIYYVVQYCYFCCFNYTSMVLVIFVIWLIYHYTTGQTFFVYLSIFVNSMVFLDSFKLYQRRIKDSDIELEALLLKKETIDCNPASKGWYRSLMDHITGDPCVEYYKNLNKLQYDRASIFQCIIDTYFFYFVKTPLKFLGASIRDFTGELTDLWPWWSRWFVAIPLLPFTTVVVVFTILVVIFRKRFKLSFFGASVEIGNSDTIKETKFINTGPRVITGYRPLRLLAKSKLFRRSDINLVKERKTSVKASKSEPAVKNEKLDALSLPTSNAKDVPLPVEDKKGDVSEPFTSSSSEAEKKED